MTMGGGGGGRLTREGAGAASADEGIVLVGIEGAVGVRRV